jgi:hypothetical protein
MFYILWDYHINIYFVSINVFPVEEKGIEPVKVLADKHIKMFNIFSKRNCDKSYFVQLIVEVKFNREDAKL